MSSIPRAPSAPLRKAYDEINSGLSEINAQVIKHNAKTLLKTTLVFASIVATGIFAAIAATTLIGYAFPSVVGNFLIPKVAIALLSTIIFNKTFGKMIYNKFERNTNLLLSKLNESVSKIVEKNSFGLTYLAVNIPINVFDKLRFKSDGLYIKELRLEPYEKIDKSYEDLVQLKAAEIRREREETAEAFRKAQESSGVTGFFKSYLSKNKASA